MRFGSETDEPTIMKCGTCTFTLPAETNLADVLAALRRRFTLRADPAVACHRRYFDSFDWRLYDAGTVCYHEADDARPLLCWEDHDAGTMKHALEVSEPPRFAHALPPGRFRDELAAVLAPRALLPLAQVRYRRQVLRLLDNQRKTTARLVVEQDATAAPPDGGAGAALNATLHVVPVKGYGKARKTLCGVLRDELGLPAADGHPLHAALAAVGRTPGDTAVTAELQLTPEMRADAAVRRILLALLHVIERNEPGLRAGLDPEFLHDFRVAVRRTRSVLGQLKSVFAPDALRPFRTEFKWLGGVTGPVRDLDVYLLKFENYQAWLNPSVRQDLVPLRAFLQVRQQQEHRRLVEALDTPRYAALLKDWHAFLVAPPSEIDLPPNAARPIAAVVGERIWHVYSKALEDGTAIIQDPKTPAEKLHRLRIDCKKLRYLMELFGSLYPPKAIKRLIKALKSLQDNLGDFNDFEVQQDELQRFALQMMNDGAVPAETFLAMGRLEARLEVLQHETRQAFAARFTRFAAPKNQRRFEKLFKPTP